MADEIKPLDGTFHPEIKIVKDDWRPPSFTLTDPAPPRIWPLPPRAGSSPASDPQKK